MNVRIAGIIPESIVDGDGVRYAIFLQGCTRHCKGCHNPTAQPLDGGRVIDTAEIIAEVKKNPLLAGITLTGGEPLLQIPASVELAKSAKALGLNVWCYTGFRFEEIPDEARELLSFVDILVDGEFIQDLKDLDLAFRGSKNQRIIDLNRIRNFVQSQI